MAYSQADVTAIEAALLALATGTMEVEVRMAGGSSVRYKEANAEELRGLLAQARAEVAGATVARRTVVANGGRGLA